MARYIVYALFLGLACSVCAETVVGKRKDIGLLTPEEIDQNLQV